MDPTLTVDAADDGQWLRLTLTGADAETTVPAGLHGVREVTLVGGGIMSAAAVREAKELESFRIFWRKPPGRLVDAAALAGLPRLSVLEIVDGYGLDAETLPDLISLTQLSISGLRRSIVPDLKSRYRCIGVRLVIEGAKPDTWLAANLNNPFRTGSTTTPEAEPPLARHTQTLSAPLTSFRRTVMGVQTKLKRLCVP
ncbi:hypothetical protein [Micromonospora sp. NPDC051006]|uniref:hypothetical protein n=1 Tax=Micromonospora sp. NPDC051006 TaxID=3364283 RepID=UPI0037A1DDB9